MDNFHSGNVLLCKERLVQRREWGYSFKQLQQGGFCGMNA